MKKTTLILVLIIQILLFFFFENISSFMNILQVKESELSIERLMTKARYSILRFGDNPLKIKHNSGFGFVSLSQNYRKDPLREKIGEDTFITFDMKSDTGATLRFREKIDTPFSVTIRKLKGMINVFVILLGIFILLTGIYLVVLFRRRNQVTEIPGIPLLQDYLTKLKESETTLKGVVDEQLVHMRKSEEISKKIVNRISAAIILLDDNGRIKLFNPFAEKVFSRSSAFALNNTPAEVLMKFPELTGFLKTNARNAASDCIISKNVIFQAEVLPLTPSGTLIIIRDITEEKKREELINSRKNFMMLGEMTSYLTHEIRNSLGVIFGYSKTLKGDSAKTDKINREILFLTEMMENFLNFSKPLNMKNIEDVNMTELIGDICAESGMEPDFTGEGEGVLRTDPYLLRSVFTNLVLNAREAGATRISVSYHEENDNSISVRVNDNGKGIRAEYHEKIWYPFFTSKPKGTGMGLALVKKIVNFLNGEIKLSDTGNTGTSFHIQFYRDRQQIGI